MVWVLPKGSVTAEVKSNIVLRDPSISNTHLRIYSILYESLDETNLHFVYAQDLSTNGSCWRTRYNGEHMIGKGNVILLEDGDQVNLCDGSIFRFRCASKIVRPEEDPDLEQQEMMASGNLVGEEID